MAEIFPIFDDLLFYSTLSILVVGDKIYRLKDLVFICFKYMMYTISGAKLDSRWSLSRTRCGAGMTNTVSATGTNYYTAIM